MFDGLNASKDLLIKFGGHSQAAGLALKKENLPKLKENLEQKIAEELTEFDLQQKIEIDAQANLNDLNQRFIKDMQHLEPFGHHNKAPLFIIKDVVQVQKPKLLKEAHVKCSVFADGVIKPIIFFNRPELYDTFVALDSDPFTIAAQVNENHWNGRVNIELTGTDIALGDTQ